MLGGPSGKCQGMLKVEREKKPQAHQFWWLRLDAVSHPRADVLKKVCVNVLESLPCGGEACLRRPSFWLAARNKRRLLHFGVREQPYFLGLAWEPWW